MCNVCRGHYGEHTCEVILNLDQWFRRRCVIKKSLRTTHTADDGRTPITIANLEPLAQISLKDKLNFVLLQSHLLLCWHGFCDVSVTIPSRSSMYIRGLIPRNSTELPR